MAEPEPLEPPHPRETLDLFGHEAAETAFLEAWSGGRVHHAWLLCGPEGVGKASFAYRVARRVLGAAPAPAHGALGAAADDPVVRRIAAQGHGDLLTIERPFDAKRGVQRADITVEEARKMGAFFNRTAGEGGWRVCIIDAADDLNVNAANALLKTLEEPPLRALILLVAHAPGRLPATVRSRCRTLSFATPSETVAIELTRSIAGVDPARARRCAELAQGRPGAAVRLALIGADSLDGDVRALLASPRLDRTRAHALADRLAAKGAEPLRAWFHQLLEDHVRQRARDAATNGSEVEAWCAAWDKLRADVSASEGLHLDVRAAVLEMLSDLHAAARVAQR